MKRLATAILFLATIGFPFLFGSQPVLACAFGMKCPKTPIPDPRIPYPRFPRSGGSSGSCLSVMSYPKEYSWYVKNTKSYAQTYWLSNKKYVLPAGKTHYFTSKVGFYSSNSCSSGTRYSEPTIEFDRYANDGRYTSKKFMVDVTNYRGFEFWKDGNTIKFSKRTNARR